MTNSSDLSALERDVYRSRFDDGLLDMLFGLVVVAWGVGLRDSLAVLGAIAAACALALWPLLRRWISRPRIGVVELSGERQALEGRKAVGLLLVGGGLLALFVLAVLWARAGGGIGGEAFGRALGGFLLAVPALLAALLTGVGRFAVHAALLAVGGVVGLVGWAGPELYVPVVGTLITVIGAVQLAGFLRAHPVRGEG